MNDFKKLIALISACCLLLTLAGCDTGADNKPSTTTATTTVTTSQKTTSTATTTTATTTSTTATTTATTQTTAKKTKPKTTTTTAKGYPYAYAGFDPVETNMNVPFNLILLNRDHRLPDGYTPELSIAVDGYSEKLDSRVAPFYKQMYDAALSEGITLKPISGYRSFTRQKNNFENRIAMYEKQGMNKVDATVKASQIVLLPGTSEHNAGLAMDICSLSVSFENTKEFRWLDAHAHEYGFIMRYPKDKTHITKITYEPWHYRYVGVEVATQLKESGMVLEEYLQNS